MTDEQIIQEAVTRVLATLKTNGRTVNQLTAVTTFGSSDYIELNGGRRIAVDVLVDAVEAAVDDTLDGLETDIGGMAVQTFTQSPSSAVITITLKQQGHAAKTIDLPLATTSTAGLLSPAEKTKLDFDGTPTSGSMKGVTSGGVKTAIDAAKQQAIDAAKASEAELVDVIDITEINNINTAAQQLKTAPSRYTVKTQVGSSSEVIVGILDVFSDSMRHLLTEVLTTHYALNSDGTLDTSTHYDNEIFIYYRSYKLTDCPLETETGTWTKWELINKPLPYVVLTQEAYDDLADRGLVKDGIFYCTYE